MIRQVLVKVNPTMTRGARLLLDQIKVGMNTYAITKDNRLVDTTKGLLPSDQVFEKFLDKSNYYKLTWDDSPVTQNGAEKQQHKMVAQIADYLRYHYNIYTEGFYNPNLKGDGMFVYEDITGNHIKTVAHIDTRIRAEWKVKNMTFKEKVDVMYYYKENPFGMTHSEVFVRLLEPQYGLILQRIPYGNTNKTIVEHFADTYKASEHHTQLKTTILKAMLIKVNDSFIIERRGDALMFGEEAIGIQVEDVMSYFINNPQMMKTLNQLVMENDRNGLDDIEKIAEIYENKLEPEAAMKEERENKDSVLSMDLLKTQAKNLRVQSYWTIKNPELLQQKVIAAEKIMTEAKDMGLDAMIHSKMMIDEIAQMIATEKQKIKNARLQTETA